MFVFFKLAASIILFHDISKKKPKKKPAKQNSLCYVLI